MVTKAKNRPAHRDQADAIRDGATTRGALGQAATHRRLSDGRRQVAWFDRNAGVMRSFTGGTLDEAIAAAIDAQRRKEPATTS
ncbi:MAG: hypothetical protein ACLQNE_35550 [Thermoguttaceae bacterium]